MTAKSLCQKLSEVVARAAYAIYQVGSVGRASVSKSEGRQAGCDIYQLSLRNFSMNPWTKFDDLPIFSLIRSTDYIYSCVGREISTREFGNEFQRHLFILTDPSRHEAAL